MGSITTYGPDQDQEYGSQPVSRGGTGARTKEQAAKNLGILSEADVGQPGGVGSLDAEGFIHEINYPLEVGDIHIPTLDGPLHVVADATYIYYISNYNSDVEYTVTVVGATTWDREDDRITLVASSLSPTIVIAINGKVFTIAASNRVPEQPGIIYPTDALVIDIVNPTVKSTTFTPGVTLEPHTASRYVVAHDISLTNVIQQLDLGAVEKAVIENIPQGAEVYVGVQYASASGFSPMSDANQFLIQATQVQAPTLSVVDNSDENGIAIQTNLNLYRTNTAIEGVTSSIANLATVGNISLSPTNIGINLEVKGTVEHPVMITVAGNDYTFDIETTQRIMFTDEQAFFSFSKTAGPDTYIRYSLLSVSEAHVSTDWQVSTQANFGTIVQSYSDDTENLTSRTFTALNYGQNYYFRARFKSAGKVGAWSAGIFYPTFSFIGQPAITTPMNNAVNQDISLTIHADAFAGYPASVHHVSTDWEISDTLLFTNIVASSYADTVNKTSFPVNGLPHGVMHYLRVRYHSATLVSEWSETSRFTTSNFIEQPTITSPTSGAPVYETTVTLQSSAFGALPDTQIHTSSDWELSRNNIFTDIFDASMASTANKTSWTVSGLTYGTVYYARVRHRSSIAVSNYSPTFTLSVSGEITPVFTAPLNNAQGVLIDSAVTVSNPFTGDPTAHISTDWQIATDASFVNIVQNVSESTTDKYSYVFDGLDYYTQYYVRARFRLATLTTAWAATRAFKTAYAPRVFTITPAIGGKSTWDLDVDGALIVDGATGVKHKIRPLYGLFEAEVKAWGAAGANGDPSGTFPGIGGPAGFAKATVPLQPGQDYTLTAADTATSSGSYQSWIGGGLCDQAGDGCGGGGLSGLFLGDWSYINQNQAILAERSSLAAAAILIAGGGGGAPMSDATNPRFDYSAQICRGVGGPGGINGNPVPTGLATNYSTGVQARVTGATGTTAGTGVSNGSTLTGANSHMIVTGSELDGGTPIYSIGGAGGGGYRGGGSGGLVTTDAFTINGIVSSGWSAVTGGGGGSSFIHSTRAKSPLLESGVVDVTYNSGGPGMTSINVISLHPGGVDDPDRGSAGQHATPGRIVIK